jgi:predicted dehydrogenase
VVVDEFGIERDSHMALDLTSEQKEIGRTNFQRVVGQYGVTRRDFMKGLLAAGAVLPVSAAAYFGYQKLHGKPVRAGLIGAGDEGGVLVGFHNPEYLEFVAYSDIRPSNQRRIFTGEPTGPRKGFDRIYGNNARKNITLYENYKDLLANKDIEAVVIALPLHLHASVAIDAMRAGKHVLCEKLMAWNVRQCKEMIHAADEYDRILSIGHQRHYSLLYAHAYEVLKAGDLGDVKHIRALWHRNNTWPQLGKDGKPEIDPLTHEPVLRDSWHPAIPDDDRKKLEKDIRQHGFKSMEELVRWRLFNRTGGGLMAELGSHQLDACSIFLGKVHPLAVSGFGGKIFYHDNREVDDHVFVTFEFPGKNYYSDPEHHGVKDKSDQVIVTYSSINTNSFEPYGECVMGTRGTMIVQSEQEVMLYPEKGGGVAGRSVSLTVAKTAPGLAVIDSSATTGPSERKAVDVGQAAIGGGPVSRGYREEMEDFAYCVRTWNDAGSKESRRLPRCHGRVAMADAIIALTSNLAMKRRQRIEFKSEWFDPASPEVPDPEMVPEALA